VQRLSFSRSCVHVVCDVCRTSLQTLVAAVKLGGSGGGFLTHGVGECRLNATYMAVHTAPLLGRHLWLKTSDHGQAPIS